MVSHGIAIYGKPKNEVPIPITKTTICYPLSYGFPLNALIFPFLVPGFFQAEFFTPAAQQAIHRQFELAPSTTLPGAAT